MPCPRQTGSSSTGTSASRSGTGPSGTGTATGSRTPPPSSDRVLADPGGGHTVVGHQPQPYVDGAGRGGQAGRPGRLPGGHVVDDGGHRVPRLQVVGGDRARRKDPEPAAVARSAAWAGRSPRPTCRTHGSAATSSSSAASSSGHLPRAASRRSPRARPRRRRPSGPPGQRHQGGGSGGAEAAVAQGQPFVTHRPGPVGVVRHRLPSPSRSTMPRPRPPGRLDGGQRRVVQGVARAPPERSPSGVSSGRRTAPIRGRAPPASRAVRSPRGPPV